MTMKQYFLSIHLIFIIFFRALLKSASDRIGGKEVVQ